MMSKISGGIIVVSVVSLVALLFLLTGSNQNPSRGVVNNFENEGFNELGWEDTNLIYLSEKNIPEEDASPKGIGNFEYTLRGDLNQFEGTLYDVNTGKGIQGAGISVYCDGRIVSGSDVQTDNSGYFYAVNDGSCESGEEAWIEISYHNDEFESRHITIPGNIIG